MSFTQLPKGIMFFREKDTKGASLLDVANQVPALRSEYHTQNPAVAAVLH